MAAPMDDPIIIVARRSTLLALFTLICLLSSLAYCSLIHKDKAIGSFYSHKECMDDSNRQTFSFCDAPPNPYLSHGRIHQCSCLTYRPKPNEISWPHCTESLNEHTKSSELSEAAKDVQHSNASLQKDLRKWNFAKTQLLNQFPIDKEEQNFVRQVPGAIFSRVLPTPMKTTTKLAVISREVVSDLLDLHPDVAKSEFFVAFASGNTYLQKALAHRYGGHQFGSWSGQLGDGRAHLLGEYVNSKGERWELQLKGSGLTPYSRRGDGKAVIRSSVREFLASEAMFHLGIPTSRAASLIVSNDPVWRDQFYDGNPKRERAAVVLRLAPSWFRIGSLEILAKNQEIRLLRQLTDFIVAEYYPEMSGMSGDDRYLGFFSTVVSKTAEMIALWTSVGFAHGVMNTDNFSVLSITIDYGPFGFIDEFNQRFVPNTSDDEGMYAIGNQATIGHFNLEKLRLALTPLLEPAGVKRSQELLAQYPEIYYNKLLGLFRRKLGLKEETDTTEYLVTLLLTMMEAMRADFTMTFRQLGEISLEQLASGDVPENLWALVDLQKSDQFSDWSQLYITQFDQMRDDVDLERRQAMNAVNPRYVLRNWIAQEVIEQVEKDDFRGLRKLHEILKNPFTEQREAEELGYSSRPPTWAGHLRVSCSS